MLLMYMPTVPFHIGTLTTDRLSSF